MIFDFKNIKFILLIIFFLNLQIIAYASIQHGPIFNLSYFPSGYGVLNLPYLNGAAGTASTEPTPGNSFSSAEKYSLSAGYFFEFFQVDLIYSTSKIKNQIFTQNRTIQQNSTNGKKSFYQIRAGKKFSNPGDTSYSWIYLGLKKMDFKSNYSNINNSGIGYLAGYEGFYSYGISYPFEFVIKSNLFLGAYHKWKYNSDIQFENLRKKNSITAGLDFGIGVQYEPNNITLLLKFSSDMDQIAYKARYSGSNMEFGCRSIGTYFGFELMYMLPSLRYNQTN